MGVGTADDAAVYLLEEGRALVQTMDIITPVADDPADFGAIAAANALSDVWAMGGTPLTALSLLAFDPCRVPPPAARGVLAAALPVLREAGCALVGGHTLVDPEMKFGLAVTGLVDPRHLTRNSGAAAGDLIYLTKPLGTGLLVTALKGGVDDPGETAEAVRWMRTLNREAGECAREAGASAVTDVTGFGLLGHLLEMAKGASLAVEVGVGSVPLLAGAARCVEEGLVPAGAYANRKAAAPFLSAPGVREEEILPLCDPQTSGGFLVAVPPGAAPALEAAFSRRGVFFARVGRFRAGKPGVTLTP